MIVTRLRYNFIGSAGALYDFCDLIAPPQQPSPYQVAFVESKRRHLADVKRFGGTVAVDTDSEHGASMASGS